MSAGDILQAMAVTLMVIIGICFIISVVILISYYIQRIKWRRRR